MKIVMIANGMDIGGAETHILELSASLQERGHFIIVASPFGAYTKELQRRNVSFQQIPAFDGSVRSFVKQMKRLFFICNKIHPDILHAHTRPGALIAILIGKRLSIPVVTTAHLPFEKKTLYEKSTRWGDHVLAVSEDIAKHLIDHYAIAANDIDIIRNGIDTERFSPKGRTERKIVHISRLDADRSKTADLLITLAPKIAALNLCRKIVIVGDGTDFKALKEKSSTINRMIGKEYVKMTGAKTDVERLLENRPIFVGVSRAALEAMACECAVVLCGNEGYSGILTKEKVKNEFKKNFCCRNHIHPTEKQLFSDLKVLLEKSNEERMLFGQALRSFVGELFDNQKMAETAERSYKVAIRKKGTGIMLCGYYGYGNMGDETVLLQLIKKSKRYCERICVMSKRPSSDQKKYGVKCISRFSVIDFLHYFRFGDVLILGGGNLLQNQTSLRSLVYYLSVAALAKLKKGKIAIVRAGIGELHGSFAKRATEILLKNCDYITCRTPKDLMEIPKSKKIRKVCFSADGSLLFRRIQTKKHFPSDVLPSYCVIVLKHTAKKVLTKKAKAIERFCKKHCVFPVFLAFDEQEDIKTIKKIASVINGSMIIQTNKIITMKKIIGGSRIVLTDRLHGAYFAITENRPFAFLCKTEKNIRHISYIKSCFEKANAQSKLLIDHPFKMQRIPPPLTDGDHARILASMMCAGKTR